MMKRAFDLIVVLLTAPFWLPVLGLVATLVRIKLGRPILFRQLRPGLGGAAVRADEVPEHDRGPGRQGQLPAK